MVRNRRRRRKSGGRGGGGCLGRRLYELATSDFWMDEKASEGGVVGPSMLLSCRGLGTMARGGLGVGLCWLLWGLNVRLRVGIVVCMAEPVWIRYRAQEIREVMKLHRYNDGKPVSLMFAT